MPITQRKLDRMARAISVALEELGAFDVQKRFDEPENSEQEEQRNEAISAAVEEYLLG